MPGILTDFDGTKAFHDDDTSMRVTHGQSVRVVGRDSGALTRRRLGQGLILGGCLGTCALALNIDAVVPGGDYFLPIFALFGAAVALTRARPVLWAMNAIILVALAVISYTPLMPYLMRGLERSDPRQSAPAVVVLGDYVLRDGTLGAGGQNRMLYGFEVLRQGDAGTLVLTRSANPEQAWAPAVRNQMNSMGLKFPVEEVGPVVNTHDEALAVARLARERGWDRIILVTDPWHMRRSAAVFEKAGLKVICSPCKERMYDLQNLDNATDRLQAFHDWLHEEVGYQWYRLRGWV
jgi:uncharacterized SAM-binding protein YcdF (DUF218 family)